jgi:hypothetical protein
MSEQSNSDGREENQAPPLGQRTGLVSNKGAERTGQAERKSAGPDGPDATEVGDTFKGPKDDAAEASASAIAPLGADHD